MRVIKRDGREVTYDRNKIIIAIHKANDEVPLGERISDEKIHGIVSSIEKLGANTLQVEEIQDINGYEDSGKQTVVTLESKG